MIPYNPSSFNSNKTILEQILEIKKWLIAHPSYKIYYCLSNFMPTGDDDRAFTEIAGYPDEVVNIAVGDLLVFPDAYYSEVIAVDLDNEMVTVALPATNFKGPQGATGPSGADGTNGTNGTCIRYCNTNKNSNPNTTYAVTDITFSTGLQINDCILFKNNRIGFVDNISGGTFRVTGNIIIDGKDGQYVDSATINSDGDLIITLYDPESMIQTNINAGHVVGADGNDGVSITNVAIDGNQHLIVTLSDGNTIDAGSVSSDGPYIITISGTSSGYITNTADRNKITSNDLDVYIYNSTLDVYFRKETNVTGGVVRFSYTQDDGTGLKNGYLYITTNNWQWILTRNTNYYKITASIVNSQTATNGQVLTANGNGGASWQNAGGKYLHTVKFLNLPETQYCISHFITSSSASLTKSDIISILNAEGATGTSSMYHFNEMGYIDITNTSCTLEAFVMGIYTNNNFIYARIVKLDGTYNIYNISNGTFVDTVTQL